MGGVFISYRRQDSAAHAGRLRADLAQRYGDAQVFLDIEDIPPGVSFSDHLTRAVADSEVVLVLIGPQWLSATDPEGRPRLHDPADFVRAQVLTALETGKRVVPVLLGGVRMPQASALPDELRPLTMRQAIDLSDPHWERDRDRLFEHLDRVLTPARGQTAAQVQGPASRRSSLLSRLGRALEVLMGRDRAPPSPAGAAVEPPAANAPTRSAPRPAPAAPAPAPHEIFVSYASEDLVFAAEVVAALETAGRRCWYAHRDIPPAVPSWAEPIVTAIANSRLAIVLLTSHSVPSVEVAREVTLAAEEKIPLLPVTLDGTALSPALRYYFVAGQRLDVAQLPPAEQIGRILPAVTRCLPALGPGLAR